MKLIRFHRTFEKHFLKRIRKNTKLSAQFEERFGLFQQGYRDWPLDDHALTGVLVGKRAFSVSGDIRVIYVENDQEMIFLDIGTHNQMY